MTCTAVDPGATDHDGQPANFDCTVIGSSGGITGAPITYTVNGQDATRADGLGGQPIANPPGLPLDAGDATTRFQPYAAAMGIYQPTATGSCDSPALAQTTSVAVYHCATAATIDGLKTGLWVARLQFNQDGTLEELPAGMPLPATATVTGTTQKTTPTTALAPGDGRATYIAKADALCKSANARQEILRKNAAGLPLTKLPPVLREQAAIAAGLATSLGNLQPMPSDRVAVGRFAGAVREVALVSSSVADSIAASDAGSAQALAAKLKRARRQETLLGQGYGYKVCGSGKAY